MPSGRPKKEVDTDILADLLSDGWDKKAIARELGVTSPTLSRRITDLKKKEGEILQYRALQSLELTELEAQILEAVTPEKIQQASLKELVGAYKILKDKELVADGKPSEIKGLVGYLIHLEKEEEGRGLNNENKMTETIEAEFSERGVKQEEMDAILCEEEDNGDEDEEYIANAFLDSLPPKDTGEKDEDYASIGSSRRPFPLNELPDL